MWIHLLWGCYWVFLEVDDGVRYLWVDLRLPGAESAPAATIINGVAALGCGAQCRRLLAVRRTSIELSTCNPVLPFSQPIHPTHTLLALFRIDLQEIARGARSTGSFMPTTSLFSLTLENNLLSLEYNKYSNKNK